MPAACMQPQPHEVMESSSELGSLCKAIKLRGCSSVTYSAGFSALARLHTPQGQRHEGEVKRVQKARRTESRWHAYFRRK